MALIENLVVALGLRTSSFEKGMGKARKELSDKARNRIRDKYNWDKIARAYIDLINTDL